MAITVPQAGQEINAASFGAPVANELNRLTPLVTGAFTSGQAAGNSGGLSSPSTMGTITIAAVPYARKIICVYHALIGYTTGGGDIQMQWNGAAMITCRMQSINAQDTYTIICPAQPLAANVAATFRAQLTQGGPLTTYADSSFNLLYWYGLGQG